MNCTLRTLSVVACLIAGWAGCSKKESLDAANAQQNPQGQETPEARKAPPEDPKAAKERAVALIQQLGGTFKEDPNILGKPIVWLSLNKAKVNAAGMQQLKSQTALTYLKLSETRIGDEGLAAVQDMKQLKTLDLWFSPGITDQGLESLKGLTQLEWLALAHGGYTGSGFVHLQGMTNLKFLAIDGLAKLEDESLAHLSPLVSLEDIRLGGDRKITDAGIMHLARLPRLKILYLNETQVTDHGLGHLKGLDLHHLSLGRTKITDAGLAHLAKMTNLAELRLGNTRITDAGLAHLKTLKKLKTLGLRGTRVTDAGLADLKAALPTCDVEK